MAIDDQVYALLSGNAGVTAIVGTGAACRVYPDAIPLEKALPAIAYSINADAIATIHGTVLAEDGQVSIACWAETRTAANALAAAVKSALVAAGRAWDASTTQFDDDTGSYAATVTLDWM